jgi:hypothetical protein
VKQESLEQVIIELPRLSEEEFYELACRIKRIYEIAEGITLSNLEDDHLKMLASYAIRRTGHRVGTLVRSTVALLQEARREDFDFMSNYELIVEGAINRERSDRAL